MKSKLKKILNLIILVNFLIANSFNFDNEAVNFPNKDFNNCNIPLNVKLYPNLSKAVFKNKELFKDVWNSCAFSNAKNPSHYNRTIAIEKIIEQNNQNPNFIYILKEIKQLIKGNSNEDFINRRIEYFTIVDLPINENNETFFSLWDSAKTKKQKEDILNKLLLKIKDLVSEQGEERDITSEGGETIYTKNNKLARYVENLYYIIENNKTKISKNSYNKFKNQLKKIVDELYNVLDQKNESTQAIKTLKALKGKI